MERLLLAEQSSDLGEPVEGEIGDVDMLRAVGAVSQDRNLDVSLALWRLMHHSDPKALHVVIRGVRDFADRRGIDLQEGSIVKVIHSTACPACPECKGRGHPVIEGTPTLADAPCPACGGSGKVNPHYSDEEKALADYLSGLMGMAHVAISRKLWGSPGD